MKKIYIFTAVLALLTLSLNAQLKARKNGTAVPPKSSTEKVEKEVTKPDGYFRMGPSRASSDPVTPPYSNGFSNSTEWDWWEVLNNNNDNKTWTLSSQQAQYTYHSSNAADDWLVTAPITLKAGKTYKFYIDVKAQSATWPERLEVRMANGHTAGILSSGTVIIASTEVANTTYQTLSNENVTVSQDGNYYFGIHAISDANQYNLFVDNVVIDVEITDPTIQTSATSVTMNSIPGSTATQTVTVTGLNLTDGITTSISGTNAAMFSVSPASLGTSGGELTISYTPTAVGTHTATLTLSSTDADDVTVTLNGTCTQELTICEGNTEIANLPVYGNYNEQYQINQMIYPADMLSGLVGKDLTSMTFYATANLSSSLAGSVWSVKLGTTDQTSFASSLSNITRLEPSDIQTVITGYALPVGENLMTIVFSSPFTYNGGNLLVDFESTTKGSTYTPTYFYGVNQGSDIGYYSYASSNTSTSNGHYEGGYTTTNLPKVTFTYEDSEPRHDLAIALTEPDAVVAGETATITATVTNNGNQTETGYTVIITVGGTPTTLTGGTLAPNATETFTIQYPTTAAQGGNTVSVAANVACTDDANLNDNDATASLQVTAQVQDLAIALNAPASVVGGNSATVTATVTNTGNQPMTGYTVTITDGTNNLLNQTATEPLAPGATATYSAEYNTTAAQVGNTVNFAANVTCADDADATNNSATASMEVITMPAPENVVATPNGQNATVTWDAPSNLPTVTTTVNETVTEGFDDTNVFPSFSIGGITATQHTGTIGDWTVYTPSSDYVYGPRNVTFDNDNDPQAWAVMNPTAASWNIGSAHSGSQFMISFCDAGDENGDNIQTTDHWLISPELSGNAQTITFWERVITDQYGEESYEVLASSTDTNPASFSLVESFTSNTTTWVQRTVTLPAGTKYFAIRHNAYDIFGVMIDDVTYEISNVVETQLAPESYNIYLDGELVGNVAAEAALTYNFSNLTAGDHVCAVSAVYPGNVESAQVPAEFTILPTPNAPAVSSNDGTTSTTITITPDANTDGQLVYYVDYNGSQTQDLTFPRGANDYTVEVHAYTTATSNYNQSPEAVVTVTIPALPQTAAPTIGISSQTDNEVTITATGNGTVTLTIPGYEPVTGNGSASITVPRQMQDYTVTASATAQATGELISTTTTEDITVPGMSNDGWIEMTETYDNPNDLLSFKVKVGNDTTDIMLIDQFMASTVHNDHPNGYTYVLKETINGEEKSSNPATVPVYKTNSNLNGFYTEAQVIADNKYDENKLTAHTLNTQIEYDVVPDNNVLYYSLYRGEKNEQRPVIDVDHRISQLQKFEDKVDGNVMYYFNENHLQGVLPRYEHIGSQTAQRLDMNYVTGTGEDELSYVPVIWTFGLYTARGDGKNNSYGSDIKHSYVGKVNISVEGLKNDGDYTTGQWKDPNGTTYCVYSPIITLGGVTPDDGGANDGDTYQYVPYMYRVWCTYPNAHNFTLLANPDGKVHLADAGAITAPFLIGEVTAEDEAWNGTGEEVIIGRALESGEAQQPWSFGVPVNESSSNVQFVARFYYKKIVTPGAQVNGLRGTRDNDEAAFAIAENSDDGQGIVTGINELADIVYVVSTTYVNAQGMQSDKPFDGLNIVVTRYSDGTTRTTKLVR